MTELVVTFTTENREDRSRKTLKTAVSLRFTESSTATEERGARYLSTEVNRLLRDAAMRSSFTAMEESRERISTCKNRGFLAHDAKHDQEQAETDVSSDVQEKPPAIDRQGVNFRSGDRPERRSFFEDCGQMEFVFE